MRTHSLTMAALAAGLILAGCAKKPPKQLPPPPGQSDDRAPSSVGSLTPGIPPAVEPGSREEFLQVVGQGGDRVFFDTDQYDLDARDRATLDQQAAWLRTYPSVRVTIEGHADERGTREYNLALGDRRANAAKNYLAAKGIDSSRMTTISWGKERPEALGSDESAWAQNRRAVTVLPE